MLTKLTHILEGRPAKDPDENPTYFLDDIKRIAKSHSDKEVDISFKDKTIKVLKGITVIYEVPKNKAASMIEDVMQTYKKFNIAPEDYVLYLLDRELS